MPSDRRATVLGQYRQRHKEGHWPAHDQAVLVHGEDGEPLFCRGCGLTSRRPAAERQMHEAQR
jgi:hypothetical protein